ncbi:M48 family metallopeptidase [Bacillus solimangrovi]|uniref:M48 family metallopeptidase n=1 Tax=Bacillus solimangrovi TaxID=1305675 RepID=UPI000ABAAE17|nr:M48 family metallopeptidase [Bacillus solimangrovi]
MKKGFWIGVGLFILYAVGIWWYLFYASPQEIPNAIRGSVADPNTFMTNQEIELSYEYSRLKHFFFFIITPFEWILYAVIIIFPLSKTFKQWANEITKFKFFQVMIYVFAFSFTLFVTMLPLKWFSYQISISYGVSVTPFSVWMRDNITSFLLNYIMLVAIALWLNWIMNRSPNKWWIYSWFLSIPFTFSVIFIQPVLIDPLYNDFSTLQNKELESEILSLAQEANIPAEHVYEVKMSAKTNSLNAYVNGIGPNTRIVLWDTTLAKLNKGSILFIMAHEMAHYVYKHVLLGVSLSILFSFIGFWIVGKIVKGIKERFEESLHINGNNLLVLPIVLMIFSILIFISSPISNYVSREMERAADSYAIELTEDKDAAISAFQQLTTSGLSEVQPPTLVYWFRYRHPSMLERIGKLSYMSEEKSFTNQK